MWIPLNFVSLALVYWQGWWLEETVLQEQPLSAFVCVIIQTVLKEDFICC